MRNRTIRIYKSLVLKTSWVTNNTAYVIWGTIARTRRSLARFMTRSSRWRGSFQAIGKWMTGRGIRVRRFCRYSRRIIVTWAPISLACHARTMIKSTFSVWMSWTLSRIQPAWSQDRNFWSRRTSQTCLRYPARWKCMWMKIIFLSRGAVGWGVHLLTRLLLWWIQMRICFPMGTHTWASQCIFWMMARRVRIVPLCSSLSPTSIPRA